MRPAIVAAAIAFIAAASSYAQTAAEPHKKCALAGTVVDAFSEQPLRDAAVSARAVVATVASASESASIVTDNDGRFKFENLAPGRYLLSASHVGYVNQAPGRRGFQSRAFDLAPGQHLDDIFIELTPGAAISGRIFRGNGEALSGVTVQALGHSDRFGKSEFHEIASGVSDKTGEYRLTALPAGNYYLRAISRQQREKKDVGANFAYVPVYFPATPDHSGSTAFVLRPGDELGAIDIVLNPVHTVAVRGRVVDPLKKPVAGEAELTLVEEGGIAPWPYQATVDTKGNFEMTGVPPGNYVLIAQRSGQSEKERTMWGQKTVQVGEVDLRNVEVAIGPGVELSGRVCVEGKANVDLTRLVGVLQPEQNSIAAGFTPAIENAFVSPEGSFVFRDVPDGNYGINFFRVPSGFYLKTARLPDIFETGVTVAHGQPAQALDLVLSQGAARIEGTVLQDQRPAAGAAVVLIPEAERRSQPRYYRQTVADRAGRFVLQNIIPGDYEVLAWQGAERSVADPEFLQQFADRGRAVSLSDGASVNMQLEVVSLE